jgi:pyridoxamine 5'-phosphate oxidase
VTQPPPVDQPVWAEDLAAFEAHVVAVLARGAVDVRSPLHTVALATVDAQGLPQVRSVILRAFDRTSRTLRVHSDLRAGKVAELRARPTIALLAWDPGAKLQVRLTGRAQLHHGDAIARAAWAASAATSRAGYAQTLAPATRLIDPGAVPAADPASLDPDAGFNAFAVIHVEVDRIEALRLGRQGHRRALFMRDGAAWSATWLAP